MDSGTKNVKVGSKPSTNTKNFAEDYYTTYGGEPIGNAGGGPALNNAAFRNSLSGYYGGQNYPDVVSALQKVNTFKPLAKPVYKKQDGGGFDLFNPLGHGLF